MAALAAAAFVAIFFDVPFPLIILAAGLIGLWAVGPRAPPCGRRPPENRRHRSRCRIALGETTPAHARPDLAWSLKVAPCACSGSARSSPLLTLGSDDVFTRIAVFFSKMAVVTFGGAYAVLAYVAQQAVETYGWLQPGEMLDGLG